MPDIRMIYKAGKIIFLLVCLFFCVSCGKQQEVFVAGESPAAVPAQEETVQAEQTEPAEAEKKTAAAEMVNINTANEEELMSLPGIGQTRAASIIDYRESIGKFEKIEDIMNVKGIKTGIFSKISSLICVK